MKASFVLIVLFSRAALFGQNLSIDSIEHAITALPDIAKVQQLYALANDHADINIEEALTLAETGLNLATQLQIDSLTFKGYLLSGNMALRIPDFNYADSMFESALKFSVKRNDTRLILQAKDHQSKSYSRQGKWEASNVLLDEMIISATEIKDSLALARAIMTKGLNFEKQSAFDQAIQHYYQALAIHQSRGDQFRVGIVLNNIGMTLQKLKRYPEALAEFQKALHISEAEKDTEGIMIYTLNIGVVYQKLEQFDEAIKTFHQSLAIAKALDSRYDIALLTANLGTVAMKQQRYHDALPLLRRAIVMKDSLGYEDDLAHTTNSLAEVYYHLSQFGPALTAAQEAERLSTQYDLRDQLSESHRLQSMIYAAQHNYAAAFAHLQQHKEISDSIFTETSDQTISRLNVQYETKLKESQISELTIKHQRSKRDKLIFLGIAFLILITGASLVYALYTRRSRDQMVIANERILHERQNQFFANISHEFRTPLTLILGPVHNLRTKFRGLMEDQILRMIQQNAERLLQLINQILDLTKFDMKTLELKKETFDATRMLQGICSSFDSMAESRDIQYRYDIQQDLFLLADRRRMEIVMINLISNAFKFTPDHGQITITAKKEGDKTLNIQVQDSGSGITEENLSRIFDRYFHDDREAHSDYEGAGIGLALSKHIMDMHGGTIRVASKMHEGTIFTIELPYDPDLAHVAEHDPAALQKESPPNDDTLSFEKTISSNEHHQMVLLVEDRKDMRDYIVSLLHHHYTVLASSNAEEGWKQAIEHIPDIIISDVMMPGKSGLEFCRELKSDIRTSHIPVMLLTAKSSPEDRLSGLETEADVYLTKPFIPEELELHIRNLLASRQKIRDFYSHHHRIEPSRMSFNSVDEQFLEKFIEHLEVHYTEESFSVEQLAELMHLSRSQVHRKLTALTGQAPNRLIRTYRLKRAYDMVSQHAASIAEIAYIVGFSSPAYFTKCFVEEFGATPGEVRNRSINV